MMDLKKNYLIITAHPDDLEMACAGTVKRILEEGGTVTNWIMVKPTVDIRPSRSGKKVIEELTKSNSILGHSFEIYNTDCYSNGRPNLQLTSNLITELENKCKSFDVIVSHWHEDYHQDHKTCYSIAEILARKNFKQFLCFDQPLYNRFYKTFKKSIYVDISSYINVKKDCLKCYDSYFTNSEIDTIIDYNSYNGSFLGNKKFAETFNLIYSKQ
jgi:LmbE family N-acetylglucosaminyl deacetylase